MRLVAAARRDRAIRVVAMVDDSVLCDALRGASSKRSYENGPKFRKSISKFCPDIFFRHSVLCASLKPVASDFSHCGSRKIPNYNYMKLVGF